MIDPFIKCPKCGATGNGTRIVDITHIFEDQDVLNVQCKCGHYLVSSCIQYLLKEYWTCYCNSFCKCKKEVTVGEPITGDEGQD